MAGITNSTTNSILAPIQNFGIGSARHCSGYDSKFLTDNNNNSNTNEGDCYDMPSGMFIIRWDINKREPIWKKQAHNALIGCLILSPNRKYIVSGSFDGEIILWDNAYNKLCTVQLPNGTMDIRHAVWSSNSRRVAIACIGYKSAVICYDVIDNKGELVLACYATHKDTVLKDKAGHSLQTGQCSNSTTADYTDCFSMCEYSNEAEEFIVVTEDRCEANDVIHKFTLNGKLILSIEIVLTGVTNSSALYMSSNINNEVLISMGNGWLIIFDTPQFMIKQTFRISQNLRCFLRDGNNILFSTSRGTLVWYSKEGVKLHETGTLPEDQMVQITWGQRKEQLWLVGFSYICLAWLSELSPDSPGRSLVSVKQVEVYMITCCGLNYNLENGDQLVAGDMAGNVYIWNMLCQSAPLNKCTVPISVRCIVWTKQIGILIGCLDGNMYRWDTSADDWSLPKVLCSVEGSLLNLRMDYTSQYVALGTSMGHLGVMALNRDNVSDIVYYTPQQETCQGSEIWSIAWSPDGRFLAAASENRTTSIWSCASHTRTATLYGHTAAVTAVEWSIVAYLVTCSDDRTVRVYSGDAYILLHIIGTTGIYGWYTLTYMQFISNTSLIACSTQNGYLVFYDYKLGRHIRSKRIHLGSIEGIICYSNNNSSSSSSNNSNNNSSSNSSGSSNSNNIILATVSSDCTMQIYSVVI